MIRMEYPKANIEGLTDREKIYALKKQLDTLTNNVQLVLESIDGDIEGINEYIGGVPDELDNSMSTISERVDEVETAVGTLEDRDYPIEQGTDGIWTYRKWNSGIAECWGIYIESSASAFSSTGNVYYRSIPKQTYPITFTEKPFVTGSVEFGNIGGCTVNGELDGVIVNVLSAVASARAVTVRVYVKGTWQ